jgi:surface carbohydrate biosynthesis protein
MAAKDEGNKVNLLGFFSILKFTNPRKNSIVILYPEDANVKRFILREIASTTLALYPQELHLTTHVMIRWLRRIVYIKWKTQDKARIFSNLLRELYAQYILACIDLTGAKVVITNIDNSSFFQFLTRLDSTRDYFAIQNGVRTPWCVKDSLPLPPHPFAKISMTNFFCFGQRDVELFSSNNHKIERFFPVGSIVGGYFSTVLANKEVKPKFDLCLVSQWKEHFFDETVEGHIAGNYMKRASAGVSALNEFIVRLLDDTDLSLAICTRNNGGKEKEFFEKFFKGRAIFIEREREDFSTYYAANNSRLTLALSSTTLSEIFVCGSKVLWCNFLEDEFFAMPEAGISYFGNSDYLDFKERVLTLINMDQTVYEETTKQSARYINNYDLSNPPHEAIRAIIVKQLNG